MGNEEKGVRKKVLEHCDYVAKIPIVEGEDSLNVSVAFGIIAFEAFKRQNFS
jgi:23S rRNA (guanosine2251-2'-O)-methyltransferase